MKKIVALLFLTSLISLSSFGQRFITKNGHIWFHSEAPLETIEAHNKQVNAALDIKTGDFVFKVLMKSFIFEKALMQEHFNENYVESDKFPNATFKGKVTNMDAVEFSMPGTYDAKIEGELTIHGITQKITADGIFSVKEDKIDGKSKFNVAIADYDISIPGAVAGKIADVVEVNVDVNLKPLKN